MVSIIIMLNKTSMVITTIMFAQQKKFANEAKEPRFNLWVMFEEWLVTTTQDIDDIDGGAEDVLVENESIEILNDDNDHLSYNDDETPSLEKD